MIWDDARVLVPELDVRTWHDTGLTWPVGTSRVALRTRSPDLVVLHATDGEGNAKTVHRVLSTRGYSVHFVVESSGRVVQFVDAATRSCAHTGGLNDRSVGIEVACRMSAAENPGRELGPRPRDEHAYQVVATKGGVKRWVRSRRAPCWGLYPAQLRALELLVPALCRQMGVPPELADERDYVPLAERAALRGVVGHVQVTTGHADPPLAALAFFRRKAG